MKDKKKEEKTVFARSPLWGRRSNPLTKSKKIASLSTCYGSLAMTSYQIWMNRQYCVYLMTNKNNTVIYTGVTSDLKKRVYEHKAKVVEGFTKRYNIDKLIYYEIFDDAYNAISREKQIKGGSRQKRLI